MGVTCVTGSNSGNCKRKGNRNMDGVAVCAETDFPSGESLETTQGRIIAGFPCPVNPLWCLANIDVAGTIASVTVAPVDARSTDEAIKARFNRFGGGNSFNQDPDLDHVAGFPVVAGGGKPGGDDDPVLVFMKEKAVAQREPPTRNSATQSARAEITRNAPIKSARAVRKGLRVFMI